jgi:hypothetical protein
MYLTIIVKNTLRVGQVFCLFLFLLPQLEAEEMEIFELKGKTLEEIMPVIEPFVGPKGTVTGMHNQLIVRTTSERMEEVKRILKELDRPPKRLLIHLRETRPEVISEDGVELSVDQERVKIGRPGGTGIRLKQNQTRQRNDVVRTVQALEGSPTMILSGERAPYINTERYHAGSYSGYRTEYQYRNIDSGFYATARLIGDKVRIEITSQRENLLPDRMNVDRRESYSNVSGKLGEWIPLADISTNRQRQEAGIAKRGTTRFNEEEMLWLKVELLP